MRDDNRLTKDFSQISDIRGSKNTLTSHFGKSALFDLTLSQAISLSKNENSSRVNSVERSRKRATDRLSTKLASNLHQMPMIRFSQNSHNILGRVATSGKDQQAEKIDVEDYWAKWLELKQKANIKTNE